MKWLNGDRMKFVLVGVMAAIVLSGGNVKANFVWTQKADMPTPRWGHTSAVVNDKIYIIGGGLSENSTAAEPILSTVEEYDPVTDIWTKKADMPTARGWNSASSAVVDGKIYVIGGDGGEDVDEWCLPTVEEYEPATNTWTRKADMPTGRDCLATVAVEGKIYAVGGARPDANVGVKTVEMYDPSTDTWSRKADLPLGVWYVNANVVNGRIYVLGGRPNLKARPEVQEYDPATDTWTRKADMPVATSQMGSVVLGDKIIVIGGWLWSMDNPYTAIQMYDPETDTWTIEGDAPFQRAVFSAEVVNNRIYVIGGTDTHHPCPALSTVFESGPKLDFNNDGIVDALDMCTIIDNWGTDEPLCDIAPLPWGDGIVDVQDLIILAEHLFEEAPLVGYWKMDETEGSIAYDSSGDHHATLYGNPVWQPAEGKIDGALQFDGIDDYANAGFVLNPKIGPFSAYAWIKGGTPGQVIISQTDGTGFGGTWLGIDQSDGKLFTNLMYFELVSESVITDGQWHHVGIVWDGSRRYLYVDEEEVAGDTNDMTAIQSTGDLYLGAGKNLEATSFFSGLIDEVCIYNRTVRP